MNVLKKIIMNICINFAVLSDITAMEVASNMKVKKKQSSNKQTKARAQNNQEKFAEILNGCLEMAKKALIEGRLDQFDALVGDTACQIRAIMIAVFYKDLINKSNNKALNISLLTSKDSDILKELVLLTCSKKREGELYPNYKESTCPRTLIAQFKEIGLSISSADNLIKKCQQDISEISVNFLKDQLKLSDFQDEELNRVLNFCKRDKFKRIQAPCYATFKVILKIIKANEIPIILKINKRCACKEFHKIKLAYRVADNSKLILCDISTLDENQAALILKGYSEEILDEKESAESCNFENYLKFLSSLEIEQIILANIACHNSFTGVSAEEQIIPFDELDAKNIQKEIQDYKDLAMEYGCTKGDNLIKKDCRLVLLYHIYCNTVKQEKE